ncbi:hypothetical protein PVK06_020702 [Gossypium arboreum]|uniref:Uncharacterized protein n=1 Tax=Gossypium arboreum TaxID=29729 RepID=A0ABR0PNK2_GOSAR|nr:hypothetical protein PVK06_020702 [Gossypium arboreum]
MEQNWKQWLIMEFGSSSMLACKKFAISFWALWYNRNKVLHEGIRERVQDTVVFINAYCLKFEQLGELSGVMQRPKFDSWESPKSDVIKINFDTSYHQKLHKSSSGIIA